VDEEQTEVWDPDEEPDRTQVWTDQGLVRLMARRCDTCIFRGGNLMHLTPGRVKGMVEAVTREEGHIPCHDTLSYSGGDLPGAICRGQEQHPTAGPRSMFLRIALAMGQITLLHPDGREETVPYTSIPSAYTKEQDEPGERPAFVHGE
jgi:hypothetical protein